MPDWARLQEAFDASRLLDQAATVDPAACSFLDQKLAFLRDTCDDHGINVTDPDQLYAVMVGVMLVRHSLVGACAIGMTNPVAPGLAGGILAGLAQFAPDHIRNGP